MSLLVKEEVERSYFKINFILQKGFACDVDEAKLFVNDIVFHGEKSNVEMAQYFVEINSSVEEFIKLGESSEIYNYVDEEAFLDQLREQDEVNEFEKIIDLEALGIDMFEINEFTDGYYRVDDNVFEVLQFGKATNRGDFYLDSEEAAKCYQMVKFLLDKGHDREIAIEGVFLFLSREVA